MARAICWVGRSAQLRKVLKSDRAGCDWLQRRHAFALQRPSPQVPVFWDQRRDVRMCAEERFDLLAEDGSLLGVTKERSLVHKHGDLHRSVHVWLCTYNGELLLQLRSAEKDTFPGCWDVSSAGHISAGNGSRDTAVRELDEELGLRVDNDNLEFLFSARSTNQGSTTAYGSFLDREIQDVYALFLAHKLDDKALCLQESEVSGVMWLHFEDYRVKLLQADSQYVPRPEEYQEKMFDCLKSRARQAT